jgi:basic membrane lipoprotein Med (substrate-binding protein (PBP1-ABC) superfamily)
MGRWACPTGRKTYETDEDPDGGNRSAGRFGRWCAGRWPAIIFDLGGKFDRSFNEAAFNGAQRWAEETGGSYREIELQSDAQREQAMRRLAEAGSNPIVMAGFSQATPLSVVAPDYPDTTFVIIDGVVEAQRALGHLLRA